MRSRPTRNVGTHALFAHMYSDTRYTVEPTWPTCAMSPQYTLAHNYNSCGPTIHVGTQYMFALNTCGPPIHVGLQYMWSYYTCGRTIHATQFTIYNGLKYMWAYYKCGPTIRQFDNLLAAHICSKPTCTVRHMYCRPTCIGGPHVLEAHMYCGPTSIV